MRPALAHILDASCTCSGCIPHVFWMHPRLAKKGCDTHVRLGTAQLQGNIQTHLKRRTRLGRANAKPHDKAIEQPILELKYK